MKKHPVDDLFQRRLKDLERIPSANAWERIEARSGKRNNSGWIWYGAAASVLLVLVAGYLITSRKDNVPTKSRVAYEKPKEERKATEMLADNLNAADSTDMQAQELAAKQELTERGKAGGAEKATIKQSAIREEYIAGNTRSEESNRHKPSPEPESQPILIALTPIEEKPEIPAAKPVLDEPAISKVNAEAEPTRTILVAVEKDQAEKHQKGSKFSRVFRQLKNARAGERVDWEEVGFNPKDLLAKVDDRLRNKEDKSQEKDHSSKNRTKF